MLTNHRYLPGFKDGIRVGGISFELKEAESFEILSILCGNFEEACQNFFVCECFESILTVEGTIIEAA